MAQRIFFLSHNSGDKPVVRQVAEGLGADNCWLDAGEIRAGENILDKVDQGIADSRVFVLFWSEHSQKSSWVQEEISQARVRALRDRGFRLAVVKLDATSLPNYLAYRLYLDIKDGISSVITHLRETARDLTPPEVFTGSPEFSDVFQDREDEMTKLETLSFSNDHCGLLIVGLDGMGKTSLVRRATTRLLPHLTPVWVDADMVHNPLRLLAALARPLRACEQIIRVSCHIP